MARLATETEASVAAEILGRAFQRDPVVSAFIREGPKRTAKLAHYFEIECLLAFAGLGEVWLDDDGLGAAIWRHPGGYPGPAWPQLRMAPRYVRLFPREFLRVSSAMNKVGRVHPREPHWYLYAVGVVPEATGRGAARARAAALRRRRSSRLPRGVDHRQRAPVRTPGLRAT